jgi:hypothetical protein
VSVKKLASFSWDLMNGGKDFTNSISNAYKCEIDGSDENDNIPEVDFSAALCYLQSKVAALCHSIFSVCLSICDNGLWDNG